MLLSTLIFFAILRNSESTLTNSQLESGLGVIIPISNIEIKKSIVNSLVGLVYPGNFVATEFYEIVKKITSKIFEIRAKPFMSNAKINESIQHDLAFLSDDLDYILKGLQDIHSYADPLVVKNLTYSCLLQFEEFHKSDLSNILQEISAFYSKLPAEQTLTDESTQILFQNFRHVKEIVKTLRNDIMSRTEEMVSIGANILPSTLAFYLETLKCIEPGFLQDVHVNFCSKISLGLFCEISLNSYKSIETYTKFSPIPYDDIIWIAENSEQILLKNRHNKYEIMSCEKDENDFYDDDEELMEMLTHCSTKSYDNTCARYLETSEYEKIINSCNFTKAPADILPFQRTSLGILVSDKNAIVKEVDFASKSIKN